MSVLPSKAIPSVTQAKPPHSGEGAPAPPASVADRPADALTGPVTIRTLHRMRRNGERFACLTCYDATTARWLERAGIPVLLVGDTAAEVILGLPGTIHAPLDFLLALTAAVKRGAPNALILGDMPFMSYQADDAEAIRNAGRFMTDGRADAVKLEVDGTFAPLVRKLARAGVAVVAHLGSKPQQTKLSGGYRSTARTSVDAKTLLDEAAAMEDAGAAMLLLEAVPAEVAERVVERTALPVIGCGAGPACHGQVVVLQDLLGMSDWQPPFAPPVTTIGSQIVTAAGEWRRRVAESRLGDHPYSIDPDELAQLDAQLDATPAKRPDDRASG